MNLNVYGPCVRILLACGVASLAGAASAQDNRSWWPTQVEDALVQAGTNRAELEKALATTPSDERKGMAFLIANKMKSGAH